MNEDRIGDETKDKLDDDVDALFKLPLAEFTGARNDLAARLKKDGRADDANFVKALTKPPISAWAVNQLHWNHRNAFNRLLAAGQRVRQAQTSGKGIADIRGSLDARSEALSNLSDLATELLRDAGHNPTPDTIHRITTTLEALSAYATLSDGPTPGRLTQDVDPPGFGSLASMMVGSTTKPPELKKVTLSQEPGKAETKTSQRTSSTVDVHKGRQAEETRRARIAAAKATLQEAKRSLTEAQRKSQRLEASQKKASAEAKEADVKTRQTEKQLREAEERYKKASAASQEAAHQVQRVTAEAKEAAKAVEDANRTTEKATKELESLLQESAASRR